MSTYGAMQDRIADELARSDLTSQIQKAIISSINYYQRERFYFNESRAITLSTSNGQEFYGSADNANIPGLSQIDDLLITVNSTRYPLTRRSWEYLEFVSATTSDEGAPQDYGYYAQQIRLYPIPDTAYTILISGLPRMTTLSSTSDTNAWMTDGEYLIRSRAEWDLYSSVALDAAQAASCKQRELEALQSLRRDNVQRMSANIAPRYF